MKDDKYGCGRDHDKSGYLYGGIDDDNMSVRSSTSNLSKTSRPAELMKSSGPKASGHRYVKDASYLKSPMKKGPGVQGSKPNLRSPMPTPKKV